MNHKVTKLFSHCSLLYCHVSWGIKSFVLCTCKLFLCKVDLEDTLNAIWRQLVSYAFALKG